MNQYRVLPVLFITILLDMIGIGMLIPVIPSLFTDPTSPAFMLVGYSVSKQYLVAGLLTALFGFMQFIASPILGELSDMYGRKKLLMMGVGVLAASQLLFAVGVEFQILAILFISRAIAGVAGGNFSIAQATIADITSPEKRARNFGLIGAAVGLGFIIGPFLGGMLVGTTGNPATPFIFAGLLGLINFILVALYLQETHHIRKVQKGVTLFKAIHNIKKAFQDHDVRPLYFAGFFANLGFAFYTAFISIFLLVRFGFSETMIGTYFAIVGLWIVFSQAIVVRVMGSYFSDENRLRIALPVLAVVIGLQSVVTHEVFLYILMPFMAASFALVSTGIPALVSKGVSGDKQGAALGINASLQALSQAMAPLVAGVVAAYFGITASFVVGSLCVVVSLLIVFKKFK